MAPAVQPASEQTMRGADRVVCKSIRETRSRISSERICKTRAEWAQDSREDQEAINDISERTRLRF
jgi:hypothetical protein